MRLDVLRIVRVLGDNGIAVEICLPEGSRGLLMYVFLPRSYHIRHGSRHE
jgi:hypothetical protein